MAVKNFNYLVSWSDFNQLATRPPNEKEDAQIHPEMSFSNFQLARKGGAVIIKDFDIDINLVPNDCWVVTSEKSDYLLNHEQRHFDILALCARDLYKAILAISAKTTADLQERLEKVKSKLGGRVTIIDKAYDKKTKHSVDQQEQQVWDGKIDTAKQNVNGSMDDLPA